MKLTGKLAHGRRMDEVKAAEQNIFWIAKVDF